MQNRRYKHAFPFARGENTGETHTPKNQGQSSVLVKRGENTAENRTPKNRPELLAPAGSFSAAYHAFEAGADAVYFGLKNFSARKGARNFTMEEVARLKTLAEGRGKRIYAALNTVIREHELHDVASCLYDLQALQVDGVIIQDLGVLYLLRRWFPGLPIHASTQMAVHNPEGVEVLKTLGVRRIILSRELTKEELRKIRQAHPDVELEVFIHGALCYSVSGLCLASGMLLGRSGNRGECAQICRSWFTAEPSSAGGEKSARTLDTLEGYFFSCKDLALCEEVLELRSMGIDAFKIEGRLKSPEWVAAVTSYYRSMLDADSGLRQKPSTDSETQLERACWIFSRSLTKGYAVQAGSEAPDGFPGILDPRFPAHRGIPIGKALAIEGKRFLIQPTRSLSVRDGLQFFRPLSGIRLEAVPFGIKKIFTAIPLKKPMKGPGRKTGARTTEPLTNPSRPPAPPLAQSLRVGKPVLFCRGGEPVWIEAPEPPPSGSEIYLISTHADALPEAPGNIPRKRIPIVVSVELELLPEEPSNAALLTITISMVNNELHGPNSLHPQEAFYAFKETIPVEKARSSVGVEEVVMKYLSPPGDSIFQMAHTSVRVVKARDSSMDGIFIPPSNLKEIRREVYRNATAAWICKKRTSIEEILSVSKEDAGPVTLENPSECIGMEIKTIPSRDQLYHSPSGIPFVTDTDVERIHRAMSGDFHSHAESPEQDRASGIGDASLNGEVPALHAAEAPFSKGLSGSTDYCHIFLPLAPVLFNPAPYWDGIERIIHAQVEAESTARVYLGLNNIGHIPFAWRFLGEERVRFFIDYGIYVANRFALRMVQELLGRLDFYYPWVEDSPSIPGGSYGEFRPPLFIGRACVYRSLPESGPCSTCPLPLTLRQGKRMFMLRSSRVGGGCLNLLLAPQSSTDR